MALFDVLVFMSCTSLPLSDITTQTPRNQGSTTPQTMTHVLLTNCQNTFGTNQCLSGVGTLVGSKNGTTAPNPHKQE
eukprot:4468706-Amphidinium_carterae.1